MDGGTKNSKQEQQNFRTQKNNNQDNRLQIQQQSLVDQKSQLNVWREEEYFNNYQTIFSQSQSTERLDSGGYSLWGKIAPYLGLVMATLAFSGIHVFSKPALNYIPPQAFAFLRISLAIIPLALTALIHEGKPSYSKKSHFVHFVMGFFGVACNGYLAFIGIKMAGPDIYSVIQPTIPVYVSLYSMTLKIEKFSWWKIAGQILAISGCLILVQIGHLKTKIHSQVIIGTIVTIFQSLSYSIFLVVMAWHLKRYPYPYTAFSRATFWGWICMGVVCAINFPQIEWKLVPWWAWGVLLYGGIVVSYIAHSTVAWAVGRVQAVIPAVSMCLQPFFTTTMAWIFLGNVLSLRDVLAMIAIIGGLILVVVAKFREQRSLEKNLPSLESNDECHIECDKFDGCGSQQESLLLQDGDQNSTCNYFDTKVQQSL